MSIKPKLPWEIRYTLMGSPVPLVTSPCILSHLWPVHFFPPSFSVLNRFLQTYDEQTYNIIMGEMAYNFLGGLPSVENVYDNDHRGYMTSLSQEEGWWRGLSVCVLGAGARALGRNGLAALSVTSLIDIQFADGKCL